VAFRRFIRCERERESLPPDRLMTAVLGFVQMISAALRTLLVRRVSHTCR
jgi:hypothetical protein